MTEALKNRKTWAILAAAALLLAVVYFAYLAAVVSSEENLEDLPIALVNEDRGGELGGEQVNLGDTIVENATGPNSPAADTVDWARPNSREGALEGIGNNEYYGAIVIPPGYSERVSDLASAPEVPIAVVNEDEGAEMGGRPVELGEEVTRRITAPESSAPPFVQWATPDDREEALDGLAKGDFYAVIAIPKDYSNTLASMSGPPPGAAAPTAGTPGSASAPPAPEPAQIKLLTSPAVRPSTTGLIEDAFAGIVGGVSGATSERVLGGLSEAGAPVPPGANKVISDPVRGEVSEADVPGGAGPLPAAPERAEIEVLTNPSAGQAAASPVRSIATGLVGAVSRATSERISEAAGARGARLTPEVAAVVGDPVRADVTEAEPVGPDSGNGQTPFFLAFLGVIASLLGAALSYFFGASGAPGGPSGANLFPARLVFGVAFAGLVAALESVVALGFLGVEHSVHAFYVFLWLWLAVACVMAVTLLLLEALGTAGIVVSALLNFLFGLLCSGGLFPLESLPSFYRAYADVLPLRYGVDGMRSLLFYDGRADAGLGRALLVLGAYLLGSAILGLVVSAARARARRRDAVPAAERLGRREELLLLGTALEYVSRRVESDEGVSPGLVRAVSDLAGPDGRGSSERERAVEASRTVLRPLSRLFLRWYVLGERRAAFGGEGGGP